MKILSPDSQSPEYAKAACDQSVDMLELEKRHISALIRAGIETIGDLLDLKGPVGDLKGIGKTTAPAIEKALADFAQVEGILPPPPPEKPKKRFTIAREPLPDYRAIPAAQIFDDDMSQSAVDAVLRTLERYDGVCLVVKPGDPCADKLI